MTGRAAVALGLLLAALAAPAPAAAYRRSCDLDTGKCFWWPTERVIWTLNPATEASAPSCTAAAIRQAARASFAAWDEASRGAGPCSSLRLVYGGDSTSTATGLGTSGEHLVVFRGGWCSSRVPVGDDCRIADNCPQVYGCFDDNGGLDRGILALTTVYYVPSSGRIVDADVELAAWAGAAGVIPSSSPPPDGWYFTCFDPDGATPICASYGQASCASRDFQNVLTHEVGHFVGLAHVCGDDVNDPCANHPSSWADDTMYPTAPAGETKKRTLSPDDVDGVCDVYPAFAPGPPGGAFSGATALAPSAGTGCGTGRGGALAVLLAVVAVLRRARSSRQAIRTPA